MLRLRGLLCYRKHSHQTQLRLAMQISSMSQVLVHHKPSSTAVGLKICLLQTNVFGEHNVNIHIQYFRGKIMIHELHISSHSHLTFQPPSGGQPSKLWICSTSEPEISYDLRCPRRRYTFTKFQVEYCNKPVVGLSGYQLHSRAWFVFLDEEPFDFQVQAVHIFTFSNLKPRYSRSHNTILQRLLI
jgi:hypothetical protein